QHLAKRDTERHRETRPQEVRRHLQAIHRGLLLLSQSLRKTLPAPADTRTAGGAHDQLRPRSQVAGVNSTCCSSSKSARCCMAAVTCCWCFSEPTSSSVGVGSAKRNCWTRSPSARSRRGRCSPPPHSSVTFWAAPLARSWPPSASFCRRFSS